MLTVYGDNPLFTFSLSTCVNWLYGRKHCAILLFCIVNIVFIELKSYYHLNKIYVKCKKWFKYHWLSFMTECLKFETFGIEERNIVSFKKYLKWKLTGINGDKNSQRQTKRNYSKRLNLLSLIFIIPSI